MTVNDTTITPQQVLDLARRLAPEQRRWLVTTIQTELADDLPEQATIDQAIDLYLADQCSLGRAAELAGITQWALKRIVAERGTPAGTGTDSATVAVTDAQAAATAPQFDGL